MMIRSVLFASLLLACPVVAANDGGAVVFQTVARVAVGADGQPEEVQGAEKLPLALRQFVESTVGGWQFEPALVDGVARTGTTWVRLSVCAIPQGDDFALSARYTGNGPAPVSGAVLADPPQYPVNALRSGVEGNMQVIYTVQPDGSATVDSITYPEQEEKRMHRYFDRSLREWVSAMRYQPEEVDGRPIATRHRTPVEFSLGQPLTRRQAEKQVRRGWQDSAECLAAEGRQPQGQQAIAQSPFVFRDIAPAGP